MEVPVNFLPIFLVVVASSTISIYAQNSGISWCSRFPGSSSTETLVSPFKENVKDFITALNEAQQGISITISSTLRPEPRQYLMHWSWRIFNYYYFFDCQLPCQFNAEVTDSDCNHVWIPRVPPVYSGDATHGAVGIIWYWRWYLRHETPVKLSGAACDSDHFYHGHGSFLAAGDMVEGYSMVHHAARHSRHNEGKAIDMDIQWTGDLVIRNKSGTITTITSSPKNGNNTDLHTIGASYGVHKLVLDPPHWSSDGH